MQKAQALVEAALVLPVMVLIFMGIIDLGRAFYYQTVLASGVHAGARAGSNPNAVDAQVVSAVANAAQDISSTTPYGCCTISPSAPRQSGQTISVTATYNLTMVTPGMELLLAPFLVGSPPYFPLSHTAQMVVV